MGWTISEPDPAHRPLDRRQALVQAAFNGIAKHGLEGLRLRDVAVKAGIDHSTVHHHFATKQDLVAEVVTYATRQFWPTMPAEGEPKARLHHHLTALTALMHERPELFVVLHEFDARVRRDPAVRAIVQRHEAGWRVVLTDLFLSGAGNGVWRDCLNPSNAAELIIATVKGVSLIPDQAAAVLHDLVTEPMKRP